MAGRWGRLVGIGAALLGLWALVVPPAHATSLESFHLRVTGSFSATLSTCPVDSEPAPGSTCTDLFFNVFQESPPNDKTREQPWRLVVWESRYVYYEDHIE